ncbi:replication-associated recombination protein A [Bartonella sp. DGB1]|uniref:replication-associated recombination protein A n=1 Tax=Bartonella sp. DGB1 TaxID=3239807 RepID=UPI003523137E
MRPKNLQQLLGQEHLTGSDGILERNHLSSMIFWGPSGTGKTTAARLLSQRDEYEFIQISAIFSGVAELKKIFDKAKEYRNNNKQTILFVDEIHRFNKTQQDSFLPVLEDGTVILIGATTENPSFNLNSALLSRARVIIFKPLSEEILDNLLTQVEETENRCLPIDETGKKILINLANGDARFLLTLVEEILSRTDPNILSNDQLLTILQKKFAIYDKSGDGHYNLISALHKSIRGSDADASLYYFCRMLSAGEDPLYLARRLIRIASEDIGLADPQALSISIAARESYLHLGSPEGELAIAQACLYLATAPKSNAIYKAFKEAMKDAKKFSHYAPPAHILNAPTKLMKELGYGANYNYDHNYEYAFSGADYFPTELGRKSYYHPVERGFEREVKKRISWWNNLREKKNKNNEI